MGQPSGMATASSPATSVMNADLGSGVSPDSRDEVAELKRQVSDLTGAVQDLVTRLDQKGPVKYPSNKKAN